MPSALSFFCRNGISAHEWVDDRLLGFVDDKKRTHESDGNEMTSLSHTSAFSICSINFSRVCFNGCASLHAMYYLNLLWDDSTELLVRTMRFGRSVTRHLDHLDNDKDGLHLHWHWRPGLDGSAKTNGMPDIHLVKK